MKDGVELQITMPHGYYKTVSKLLSASSSTIMESI